MKKNVLLFVIIAASALSIFTACSEDNDQQPAPEVTFSVNDTIHLELANKLIIEASVKIGNPLTHRWLIDQKVCSEDAKFEYQFEESGTYQIQYVAKNEGGELKKEFTVLVAADARNMYVTTLFEYCPAPGQFINKAPGNLESAEGILGKKGMVTLGAWGGYAVYGFDHAVVNQPEKEDVIIYNNAMSSFSEPGIIWVMQDENGNGKPDDIWYEVAGSEFGKAGYKRNYSITYYRPASADDDVPWKDSEGKEGLVKKNTYHKQAYFPQWIQGNSYTLTGSWLAEKVDRTNPSNILSLAYDWGYADNTYGGDRIDIANAMDETGKKVVLNRINFIKIQTAVVADMGWLGELSTEIIGIADLSMVK